MARHVPSSDTTQLRSSVVSAESLGSLTAVLFSPSEAVVGARALNAPITIGRGRDCEISLADPAASRNHTRLIPSDGRVEVIDLGSRNGTFLDGSPVVRARAGPDSIVRVGDTLIRICWRTEAPHAGTSQGPLIGGSSMAPIQRLVSLVGPTTLPVLILGETGTGKDVIARLLHASSGRRGPFVAVNCAALPESLVESELFGHVRGAFTDSGSGRKGLFAAAAEGTLFLDEVGDLPAAAQAKLLRVLEDGLVRAVGSEVERRVNVRILAATNRNLSEGIAQNGFRADLFARLSAVQIRPLPLRERPEDLPLLISFLTKRAGKASARISADALEALALYPWPQNIRELDNVLRAAMLEGTDELGFDRLPERIQQRLLRARAQARARESVQPALANQRAQVEEALLLHQGNLRRVSASVGLARSQLYRLLARWNIDVAQYRRGVPSRPAK